MPMPDFDYDVHKEELKLQKQQWAEELSAEQIEEKPHWPKQVLICSRAIFVAFVLLVFLPKDYRLYNEISLMSLICACCIIGFIWKKKSYLTLLQASQTKQQHDKILPSALQIQPHIYSYSISTAFFSLSILLINNFKPYSALLMRIGSGICDSLAILGIILAIYLYKYFCEIEKK